MAWTNITKPSVASYINVNPQGREQYDEVALAYDDINVFYDGVNQSQWSDISKPVSSLWTKINKPT